MMLIRASNSMLVLQRSVHRLVRLMFIDGRQDVNACIFKGGKKENHSLEEGIPSAIFKLIFYLFCRLFGHFL